MHGELRYESGGGKDNIGYLTNPADWAEWKFEVTQPGKMQISAEIAAEESGKFTVSFGEQKLTGTAPKTGDFTKFKRVSLGTLELATGDAVIQVRPVNDGWQPMNLKSVSLSPAK